VSVSKYVDGRGRERWRVNYELPPHPDGRRRKSTKRGFPTRRAARAYEDEMRGRVSQGDIPPVRERRQTVAGYLRAWYVGVGGKETWRAHCRNMCERYLIPYIGGIGLEKLTAEQVDWLYRMLEREGGQRGLPAYHPLAEAVHRVVSAADGDGVTVEEIHARLTVAASLVEVRDRVHALRRSGYLVTSSERPPADGRRRRFVAAKPLTKTVAPESLSPKTVRNVHIVLHRALSVAVERGHVRRNVAGLAHPPSAKAAKSRNSERVWTPEQLRAWLAHVQGDRLFGVWRLIATTGLRRGEACGLHWADVDLESGAVRVRWELTVVDGRPVWVDGAKTPAGERTVELDAETVSVLRTHHARLSQEKLAAGPAYHDHGLVVCWPDGSLVHPDRLLRALYRHAKALGLPRIDVHGLRHSYATMALDDGVDHKVVQERLGHASAATTMDVYRHVSDAQHRAAAERIARRITG
jgi:integrase